MTRQAFDIGKAISAAWAFLWADNLAQRAAGRDFRGQTTYLTATDLERQVRAYAQEQADGKAWGSTGRGMGCTVVRIGGVGPGGLLGRCRDWLRAQVIAGRLEVEDLGRGHISGARYRPRGEGRTDAERATLAAKARRRATPRPVHASRSGSYGGRALCVKVRSPFSRPSRTTHTTGDRGRVTCPRCLKILETTPMPAPRRFGEEA